MKRIGILGVKDRVGASSLALELAHALKHKGAKALLVDADPFHQGDLRKAGGGKGVWRTLSELEKIPSNIAPEWLCGFLKGPGALASLQLANDRLAVAPFAFKKLKEAFQGPLASFEWVIADLGSRVNLPGLTPGVLGEIYQAAKRSARARRNSLSPSTRGLGGWGPQPSASEVGAAIPPIEIGAVDFLADLDLLLFVLNPDLSLVEELQRKLTELSESFFPKQKMGWVGARWEASSVLTPASLSKAVPIRFFGLEVSEVVRYLEALPASPVRPSSLAPTVPPEFLLEALQKRMESLKETPKDQLRSSVAKTIRDLLDEEAPSVEAAEKERLMEVLLNESIGLGPLEPWMKDPQVTEILINGPTTIYLERNGKLQKSGARFLSAGSLRKVMERILMPVGRRIDEASPMVDCRLPDGSRVNMIITPLALEGPIISIRRFSKEALQPEDLIRKGSAAPEEMELLRQAVRSKKNILVSGGTGSGKTTLLNILSSFIPPDERIITIEDSAELKLNQPHVVRLESRPPNVEGKGEITIRDLVRNALRMRPDRIIVGECRGAEALDMLTAMNTGHEGSLTTLHANSPRDAIGRLETLVHFAGLDLPSAVIRDQIFSAIGWIVQTARLSDGSRKITEIVEVKTLHENRSGRSLSLAG